MANLCCIAEAAVCFINAATNWLTVLLLVGNKVSVDLAFAALAFGLT
jgi:hypothetical protein